MADFFHDPPPADLFSVSQTTTTSVTTLSLALPDLRAPFDAAAHGEDIEEFPAAAASHPRRSPRKRRAPAPPKPQSEVKMPRKSRAKVNDESAEFVKPVSAKKSAKRLTSPGQDIRFLFKRDSKPQIDSIKEIKPTKSTKPVKSAKSIKPSKSSEKIPADLDEKPLIELIPAAAAVKVSRPISPTFDSTPPNAILLSQAQVELASASNAEKQKEQVSEKQSKKPAEKEVEKIEIPFMEILSQAELEEPMQLSQQTNREEIETKEPTPQPKSIDLTTDSVPAVIPRSRGRPRASPVLPEFSSFSVDFEIDSIKINSFAGCTKGEFRSLNQDSYSLRELDRFELLADGNYKSEPILFAGVFDGHGALGESAAALTATLLPNQIQRKLVELKSKSLDNNSTLLISSISETQGILLKLAEQQKKYMNLLNRKHQIQEIKEIDYGTTACAAIVSNKSIELINVGDSRAILFQLNSQSGKFDIVMETRDHDPTADESERDRIVNSSGLLAENGRELRVYPIDLSLDEARRRCLTLNMSRSLGHTKLSNHGISSDPDYSHIPLVSNSSYYLILGSDGLFDQIKNTEIQNSLKSDSNSMEIVHQWIKLAEKRWKMSSGGDNSTMIVIKIVTK